MADYYDAEIYIEGPKAFDIAQEYFADEGEKFVALHPRETRIHEVVVDFSSAVAHVIDVRFQTAWGPPYEALDALRKLHPGHEFTGNCYFPQEF